MSANPIRSYDLEYNLSSLGPGVVTSLKKSLTDEAEVGKFLERLKAFLEGSGKSAAEKDLAFSLGAELNSSGIIDMISLSDLKAALSEVGSQKVEFFIKGLPKRHRDKLEDVKEENSTSDQPVVVKAMSVKRQRGALRDPIGDMLTRIRNAQMRGKSTVSTPASKLRSWVLDVLRDEGYIQGYTVSDSAHGSTLKINLKYYGDAPVIREIKRVSKPGRRVYPSVKNLSAVRQGLGLTVVRVGGGVSIVRTDEGEVVGSYDLVSALH